MSILGYSYFFAKIVEKELGKVLFIGLRKCDNRVMMESWLFEIRPKEGGIKKSVNRRRHDITN